MATWSNRWSTPPRFCGRFNTRARAFACATSWTGPASARGCASASSTRCGTVASSKRPTATAIASRPRSGGASSTGSVMPLRGRTARLSTKCTRGLLRAAERERVELIVVDNRYQPKVAVKNAELLIRDGVDLVIEFQTDESVAPAIAAKYHEAKIPLVAIDIPHPGATYFGANNYEAGLLAGRYLGKWARQRWNGHADEILLVSLARAGSLPASRIRGAVAGIREVIHEAANWPVVSIDGDGQFKTALERVRRHLRASRAKRILVAAANDPSALGAARAFEEAGRGSRLRHRRAERRTGRACRAAPPAHAARRLDRLFSGEVRGRTDPARARYPGPPRGAAGGVCETPGHHARERRPFLSQRRAHGRRDLRASLATEAALDVRSCETSTAGRTRLAGVGPPIHRGADMSADSGATTADAINEYERTPVPARALLGLKSFVGQYAGEHTAGAELMIGPLFVAAGVGAFDLVVGLFVGNLLAVLSWTFLTAPIATRRRLTLSLPARKDLRPAARDRLQPRQRPDVLLSGRFDGHGFSDGGGCAGRLPDAAVERSRIPTAWVGSWLCWSSARP